MTTRLVSILGLGNPKRDPLGYDPVEYAFEGRRASRTALISRAHVELFEPVDSVVFLGTAEVERDRVATGAVAEALGRPFHFIKIPKGQSEAERWDLFSCLRRALDLTPIEQAGEVVAPDRILFDVTHGFRTQPLFAMSVLSYMQSEWAREGVTPPALRVLYGAHDPQNPPPAGAPSEVWDLTQQLTVTRWNLALDALQRYGRADDLAVLSRETSKALTDAARSRGEEGGALRRYGAAGRFGEVAQKFADDLALGRFRDIIVRTFSRGREGKREAGSAEKLREFLAGEDARFLTEQYPLLADSLARLARWVAPLIADRIGSRDGLRALGELAIRYGSLQRFAEQFAAVREGTVLRYGIETGRPPTVDPGGSGFLKHLESLADELGRVANQARDNDERIADALRSEGHSPGEALEATVKTFGKIAGIRNDALHGGLNDAPNPAKALRGLVERQAAAFASATRDAAPCFVNLSNHPVATWSTTQREAARSLDLGEPADLAGGMPLVRPSADEEEVSALAEALALRAVLQGARGAFVATDATLTVALVGALQARGLRCFAATTERVAREVSRDGRTVTEREFAFIRWREYASR